MQNRIGINQSESASSRREVTVKRAVESDIHDIFRLAQGRYDDTRINGPDIKIPWWRQNPNIFHVIHDADGKVCANLNLLPLKNDCYQKIRQGELRERDIQSMDIFTPHERDQVKDIYVEGFNCKWKIHAYLLLAQLREQISILADPGHAQLRIGAMAGTAQGKRIMEKLGFMPTSHKREDKPFLEIEFGMLAKNLAHRSSFGNSLLNLSFSDQNT